MTSIKDYKELFLQQSTKAKKPKMERMISNLNSEEAVLFKTENEEKLEVKDFKKFV
jgi:hypothetical protein